MAKIFLLASNGIKGIPAHVKDWLVQYASQGHEFIVGDTQADGHFHNAIASFGGKEHCTIYAMDKVNTNVFNIKSRVFDTYYDENTKSATIVDKETNQPLQRISDISDVEQIRNSDTWYKFKDRLMVDECAAAIIVMPEGAPTTKRVQYIIQRMAVKNKPRYIERV